MEASATYRNIRAVLLAGGVGGARMARGLSAVLPPNNLTIVVNVAFLLGWGFRLSGPAFALLLLGILCYRNSWSMIYHSDNLLILQALVLGWTRAADALSIDELMRRGATVTATDEELSKLDPSRASRRIANAST